MDVSDVNVLLKVPKGETVRSLASNFILGSVTQFSLCVMTLLSKPKQDQNLETDQGTETDSTSISPEENF